MYAAAVRLDFLHLCCRVEDLNSFEYHYCTKGCTAWDPLPRTEWAAHQANACTKCGETRFSVKRHANGRVLLKPNNVIGQPQ